MASSIAHDSHNVIAVGVSDEDIVAAVNLVMDAAVDCRRPASRRMCATCCRCQWRDLWPLAPVRKSCRVFQVGSAG